MKTGVGIQALQLMKSAQRAQGVPASVVKAKPLHIKGAGTATIRVKTEPVKVAPAMPAKVAAHSVSLKFGK